MEYNAIISTCAYKTIYSANATILGSGYNGFNKFFFGIFFGYPLSNTGYHD